MLASSPASPLFPLVSVNVPDLGNQSTCTFHSTPLIHHPTLNLNNLAQLLSFGWVLFQVIVAAYRVICVRMHSIQIGDRDVVLILTTSLSLCIRCYKGERDGCDVCSNSICVLHVLPDWVEI